MVSGRDLKYTKVQADVLKITERAALLGLTEQMEEVWIPLSQMFGGGHNLEEGSDQEVQIQTWFYEKKIAG